MFFFSVVTFTLIKPSCIAHTLYHEYIANTHASEIHEQFRIITNDEVKRRINKFDESSHDTELFHFPNICFSNVICANEERDTVIDGSCFLHTWYNAYWLICIQNVISNMISQCRRWKFSLHFLGTMKETSEIIRSDIYKSPCRRNSHNIYQKMYTYMNSSLLRDARLSL